MFATLFICGNMKTQTTYTYSTSDVTLQCSGGTSNRTGVAYNPCFNLYYSVDAGNSSYPIETFPGAGGTSLNSTSQGADYRGYWWNSLTNLPEGNSYNSGGVYSNSLNSTGYAQSTTSFVIGSTMPNSQSAGACDPVGGFIYYYNSGTLYKYNKSTNTLISSTSITGLPVSSSNLNSYHCVYTGYSGSEIGVYDYVNRKLYFLNASTAGYVSSLTLPSNAPSPSSFQMGFANNRFFLYNTTLNQWWGYPVGNAIPMGVASTTVTASNYNVCIGNPVTLNATGATNYTWSSGGTGSTTVVTPTVSSTYMATGVDPSGCLSSGTVAISIIPGAYVTAAAAQTAICIGSSANISAGGGVNTYTWLPVGNFGGSNSSNITDSPLASTVYTVLGTNNIGCVSTYFVPILVSDPQVTVSPSQTVICEGQSALLSASGASVYSWSSQSGGFSTINSGTLLVNSNTMSGGGYDIQGTDMYGCIAPIVSATVTVLMPSAAISGPNTICTGNFYTLTASGADTYTWNNTGATTPSISISPNINTTYTLIGMDSQDNVSCYSTTTLAITVYNSPNIAALSNRTLICQGDNVSLSAVGAITYTWTNGATTHSGSTWQVSPQSTQIYTISGTNQYNCVDTKTLQVTVNPCNGIAKNNSEEAEISIYPNPVSSVINIVSADDNNNQTIEIFVCDILGNKVIQNSSLIINNTTTINVTELKSGVYFLQIGNVTRKFVKE